MNVQYYCTIRYSTGASSQSLGKAATIISVSHHITPRHISPHQTKPNYNHNQLSTVHTVQLMLSCCTSVSEQRSSQPPFKKTISDWLLSICLCAHIRGLRFIFCSLHPHHFSLSTPSSTPIVVSRWLY